MQVNEIRLEKSIRRLLVRVLVRVVIRPAFGWTRAYRFQRHWLALVTKSVRAPRGTRIRQVRMNGVPGERLEYAADEGGAILYLHGGGYVLGQASSCRSITGQLARDAGAAVFAIDYRLAPEHRYPAAVEDAVAAYRWLLQQGYKPGRIALAGDSAGGGLALATALALRAAGDVMPAALALISPWVDLTLTGPSLREKAHADPMLRQDWLRATGKAYMHDRPLDDPGGSPLFADLTGLPPLLVQVGSDEILLSDSLRLVESAQAAGVEVWRQVYAGLWHDFQLHAGLMPEADAALDALASQLRESWQPA